MKFRFIIAAWLCQGLAFGADGTEANGEAQFLSNVRQLVFEGRRSGEGYFAPDGKALIFQSEREANNPFYQIYILNLTSGDIGRVSPGMGKTTCAFFRPRTDEVLFASTHLDPESEARQKSEFEFRASGKQRRYSWDYDEAMDIFVTKREGTNLRRLTSSQGYDAEGSFSPDGKQIVFCSLRDAYPLDRLSAEDRKRFDADPAYFGEIYLMNADGSNVRRLTRTPGYDGGPFFSPDGRRIIWRRFEMNGVNADVFTMKLDGSDVRRLTDFQSMSWAPYFHPSGKYLIFTSNKLGFSNFELHLVDGDGKREPVRVTFTDGFDGLPVFSPDGKKLCWTSNRTADGKSQLFLADWNHEAALAALRRAPQRGVAKAAVTSPARATPNPTARTVLPATSQFVADITAADLRRDVEFLASDELQGRMTGTSGAQQAAAYLGQRLHAAGVYPFGASNTFFQPFEFAAGVQVVTNENHLSVNASGATKATFISEQDFRPLAFTANGTIDGEVIFAGYGLAVPGKPGEGYDSYAAINVSNKIALVLRYVPEGVDAKRRQELNRYAGLRYKAMLARERGAKAVLFVTGPNSPNAGELISLSSDGSNADSGIVAVSVTSNVVNTLFGGTGWDLKSLQSPLDKEDPHALSGLALTNVTLRISTAVQHFRKTDRNVLGVLPPARQGNPSEYVLVGAHYDHLGHGETGAMGRQGEEHQVHPGADDNASGTSAVLELAASLVDEQRRNPGAFQRGVIFALWSGEELGLIGSSYFAEHPAVPLTNVAACVNFDMVGRLRDNKLNLQGVGSSGAWRRLLEKRNVLAGFNLTLQDDPYLPTDVTALYPKNVPVLNFFTGGHEDYHRPTDKPGTLNYEGLERITKFARTLVLDLVQTPERPDYVKVERSGQGGGRDALRVYLGTIPDYATEVSGVKLSGARAGSPADKAGLKGGDVIVEFAGQKIANIYDYTYALDAAKIGQPLEVVVMRDGQRLKVSVTPEARK